MKALEERKVHARGTASTILEESVCCVPSINLSRTTYRQGPQRFRATTRCAGTASKNGIRTPITASAIRKTEYPQKAPIIISVLNNVRWFAKIYAGSLFPTGDPKHGFSKSSHNELKSPLCIVPEITTAMNTAVIYSARESHETKASLPCAIADP